MPNKTRYYGFDLPLGTETVDVDVLNNNIAGVDVQLHTNAENISRVEGNKAEKTDTVLETTLSRGRREGFSYGEGSFAFGYNVVASGTYSHAEGSVSTASERFSHAEGVSTTASGEASHAEGNSTRALTYACHAEGTNTLANGQHSHAEGLSTQATNTFAHAEGYSTTAAQVAAHAEGYMAQASGMWSHAEGRGTLATAQAQHVFGEYNKPNTTSTRDGFVEIVGNGTSSDTDDRANARALDWNGNERLAGTLYVGCGADSTGGTEVATKTDTAAKADKTDTVLETTLSRGRQEESVIGVGSFAFGYGVVASGSGSHSEGASCIASGQYSHAEGTSAQATGYTTHAEGASTVASGSFAHAEGLQTSATNNFTHAEGYQTQATATGSHAEGDCTTASGTWSHAEGIFTEAAAEAQHVFGKNNKVNSTSTRDGFVEIVGNGTSSSDTNRSNARALDWNGNERLAGTLYVGCNADSSGGTEVATKSDLTVTLQTAYPVGAVFMSTVNTSPQTLFGFGTWTQAANGNTVAIGDSGLSAYIWQRTA